MFGWTRWTCVFWCPWLWRLLLWFSLLRRILCDFFFFTSKLFRFPKKFNKAQGKKNIFVVVKPWRTWNASYPSTYSCFLKFDIFITHYPGGRPVYIVLIMHTTDPRKSRVMGKTLTILFWGGERQKKQRRKNRGRSQGSEREERVYECMCVLRVCAVWV